MGSPEFSVQRILLYARQTIKHYLQHSPQSVGRRSKERAEFLLQKLSYIAATGKSPLARHKFPNTPLQSSRISVRNNTGDNIVAYLRHVRIITSKHSSRDYAIVDEAVFSPCCAEDSRPEPRRAEP
jgi:hypothetical protein